MKRLLFICHILFLFGGQSASAEIFTVTNTADSGPGSLRDAIEKAAANGNRETDYIYFNITRARDLFIRIPLNNPLPALTSDLIIDGTTQPGSAFGVTNAKVGVLLEGFSSGSNMLYCLDGREARDLKIYGLFIKAAVVDRITMQPPSALYGILLGGTTDCEIGQPGKGNLISGWGRGVYDISNNRWGNSARITIRSNIFGLDIDGVSMQYMDRTGGTATNQYSISFEKNSNNNKVGGPGNDEGNVFNSSVTDIHLQGMLQNDGLVTITNNRFGIDVNGDNIASSTSTGIRVFDINTFPGNPFLPATPVINNNYFGGKARTLGILATNVKTNFLINDNILGYEDRSGQPPRDANYSIGIMIRNSEQATVRNNTIRYWKNGAILMDTTYSITFSNNSTYCNKKRAIALNHWTLLNPPQRPFPFAYINTIAGLRSSVAGTAVPRSKVELFYNDPCPNCEGKTLLATVQADLNGNWQYSGPITGDNIVATATDVGGATSEYSRPAIDTSSLVITPTACVGSLGSICGLKILSGTNWHWEDINGNNLGIDTCLLRVPAGYYFLKISIGSSCEEVFSFRIDDVTPTIDVTNVDLRDARCNGPYGYICGLNVRNAISISWENEFGTVVSTNLCFNYALPGKYRLRAKGQQNCDVLSPYFEIKNVTPRIDASNVKVIQPSCGKNNGSIKGVQIFDTQFSRYGWYDENGVQVSTGTDLIDAPEGIYKFVVKDVSGICGDSTSIYTLIKIPAMQMNLSNVQVVNASCGNSNGSISGIIINDAVGNVSYEWIDAQKNIVANTLNLYNVSAGNYQLKVKDGSNCDTLFSSPFTIINQGSILLDVSSIRISSAGCTKTNGGIAGIIINGATDYEWRELPGNNIVSNAADLLNVAAGQYQLRAYNKLFGCSALSAVYEIPLASPVRVDVLSDQVQDARCGLNNGAIQLNIGNASAFSFNWLKDSSTSLGSSLSLTALAPGTYYGIATDTNGCVQNFYKKTIAALPLPKLDESRALVRADTCGLMTGSINGIVASSDVPGLKFEWTNETGRVVSNQLALVRASSGDYQLKVTDTRGCVLNSGRYTLPAITITLPAPSYTSNKIEIPRNSDANLRIQQSRLGQYELIDAATGNVLQRNGSGDFVVRNVSSDMVLQVKYYSGPCSSAATQISIKVFDNTRLTVPNAFSPNSDGVNDEFKIGVEGYFLLKYLKIYNRYGQPIHEIRDIRLGWNGRKNGAELPVGTYYWVLEGIDVHNKPLKRSGSVTLLR